MRSTSAISTMVHALYATGWVVPTEEAFYWELMAMLDAENISPQLYHLVVAKGQLHRTPQYFQNYLKTARRQVMVQNLFIKAETDGILRALDEANIPVIWLKGTRFAERYFGDVGARITSDIDLLVDRGFAQEVRTCLQKLGYELLSENPEHYHDQYGRPTHDPAWPLLVEIHFDLIQPGAASLNLVPFWNEAEPVEGYAYVREFSEQRALYAACIHAANHALNHVKHGLDIVHLIARKNSQVSLEALIWQVKQDHTLRLMQIVLSSVYEEFPFLHSIHPLPEVFHVWKTRKQMRLYLRYDLAIRDGWVRKGKYLIAWFFPRKFTLAKLCGTNVGDMPPWRMYARLYRMRWSQFRLGRTGHSKMTRDRYAGGRLTH